MQTFMPCNNFEESAKVLDYRRLGKQRVEAKQIIDTLEGRSHGWKNHPAVKMWGNHIPFLKQYYNAILREWIDRGYNNTMKFMLYSRHDLNSKHEFPPWMGNPDFHASHRSNLLRKDPEHYGQFGWSEPSNLPYLWPVND